MEALNVEILNPGPILHDLRLELQRSEISDGFYLRSTVEISQPAKSSADDSSHPLGIQENRLPEIFSLMGVRSVTLNSFQDLAPLLDLDLLIPSNGTDSDRRLFLTSDTVSEVLKPFLDNCRTIAFYDWASLSEASDLWTSLFQKLKHADHKQDIEFIFYLGDPLNKRTFQVEQAIDLISRFTNSGQVTLALDEHEAINLWMVLNGVHDYDILHKQAFPDLKRKYISIFRTIGIDRLLIYSATNAMVFTRDTQMVLARKKTSASYEIAPEARNFFIEGFSIGLLRKFDIVRCLALGLIVFGTRSESTTEVDLQSLISYVDQWAGDLLNQDTIFLYQ